MAQESFNYRKRPFQVVYFPWYLVITETTQKLFRNFSLFLGGKGGIKHSVSHWIHPVLLQCERAVQGVRNMGTSRVVLSLLPKSSTKGTALAGSPTEEQRQAEIAPLSRADKATFQTQPCVFFFSTTEISGKP